MEYCIDIFLDRYIVDGRGTDDEIKNEDRYFHSRED